MPFANTSTGANLYYEELNATANSIPIVALHGLLGTGRKDLGGVIDWLATEGYRVIAPSLRGYGQSTPKPRDFPYKFYNRDADDILAFLAALNIEKCHLLGYSDGGEIALICSGTRSQNFISVATIGAVGYMGPDTRTAIMGYRFGSQWITQEELKLHSIPNANKFAAQWVRSMVMMVDSGGDVAVSIAQNITAPLLMMLGKKDKLNPGQYAEAFLERVNNGRLVMFNAGHALHEHQEAAFRKTYLRHIQAAEKTNQ